MHITSATSILAKIEYNEKDALQPFSYSCLIDTINLVVQTRSSGTKHVRAHLTPTSPQLCFLLPAHLSSVFTSLYASGRKCCRYGQSHGWPHPRWPGGPLTQKNDKPLICRRLALSELISLPGGHGWLGTACNCNRVDFETFLFLNSSI